MKNMKVKYLLALLLIVCSVATGYAQQITVKGQVWDEVLNEPLIGVNVSVKGTTNGVKLMWMVILLLMSRRIRY